MEKSTHDGGGGEQGLIPLAAPSLSRAEPEQRGHRCPGRPGPPYGAAGGLCPPRCGGGLRPYRSCQPTRAAEATSLPTPGGGSPTALCRWPRGVVLLRRFVRRRCCLPGRTPVSPTRAGPGPQLPHPWHCLSAPSLLRHPESGLSPLLL